MFLRFADSPCGIALGELMCLDKRDSSLDLGGIFPMIDRLIVLQWVDNKGRYVEEVVKSVNREGLICFDPMDAGVLIIPPYFVMGSSKDYHTWRYITEADKVCLKQRGYAVLNDDIIELTKPNSGGWKSKSVRLRD